MSQILLSTALSRGLRLKCPRCGKGRLFHNFFAMYKICPECDFQFERSPGYFLGSAYINYGFTALTLTALYVGLHFGAGYDNKTLLWPLLAYVVIIPLIFFRFARSLWLCMDCFFDSTGFEQRKD